MSEPMPGWWWLSFADSNLPEGSQFLGVAVVRAYGFGNAVMKTHMLGINPGGEVQGIEVGADVSPPVEMLNNLVSDKTKIVELESEWSKSYNFSKTKCREYRK